jgi:hypothetical protein
MKMSLRGLCWIVVGGLAAISCGGSGTSGPGTGGSGGAGPGGVDGGSGVAGNSAGGRGGSASGGSTGAAGSTAGTAGTSGGAGNGGTGAGGATGGGGASGGGGSGGGVGGNAGGGTGGASAGAGGRGGSSGAAGGAAGAAGGAGGAAGRGGSGGTAGAGGAAGATGGRGGAGGTTSCAGRAVSLSGNGTGGAADTAYAHVEMDLGSDLPVGNSPRTVEFWAFIKTTDWVGEKNEVYYYGGSANAGAFGLDFGTNPVMGMTNNHATLNPITGGGFNDDSTNDLGINSSTDQWVHIAMTWNGTNVITYVNGLPKITTAGSGVTALATAASAVIIGCNPTNNSCFNGLFDELRIWNVARTATQIHDNYNKQVANSDTGLVGYWKFDETSGTTTADAVSGGGHTAHNGTLKANTTALPTFVVPPTPLPLVCN